MVVKPEEPSGELYAEAQAILKARAEKSTARKEARDSRPVPNHICYRGIAFFTFGPRKNIDEDGNWLGSRVPKCRLCGDNLQPNENHKCSGWNPKWSTSDLTWEERRDLIKAAWDDWDDDQYDPTTPQEGGFDKMLHEAETGETYDQVVREDWDENDFIAWKTRQLGYAPWEEEPDCEPDVREDEE